MRVGPDFLDPGRDGLTIVPDVYGRDGFDLAQLLPEHRFRLIQVADNVCRFRHQRVYRGAACVSFEAVLAEHLFRIAGRAGAQEGHHGKKCGKNERVSDFFHV